MPDLCSRTIKNAITFFLLAACCYFVLTFVFLVLSNFFPGPYNDYWVDIWNVEKAFNGQLTFDDLINAHNNAHRIFIPRLIFILDYAFFHGSNGLIVVVCLLCKLATWMLFNRIIHDQNSRVRLWLNVLLLAALLNADNVYNIIYSSNVQWDLMILFSVLAVTTYSFAIVASGLQKIRGLALAWLWFVLGFLSQAGTLPVLFVFLFISLLQQDKRQTAINLVLMLIFFYLNFFVFPVSNPENPTFGSALAMLILAPLTVLNFMIHLIASGIHWYIKTPSFYFSAYLLLLLVTSLVNARKTRTVYHNVFLHLALCAFLMIAIIAAARSMFGPGQWAASRFHVVPLLFIPCLTLHAFFSVPLFFQDKKLAVTRAVILSHSLVLLLLVHFYTYRDPIDFSNKVFDTQAYMLTHERDQFFGSGLRIHLWEHDPIAHIDPFFREHGYAYYDNKMLDKPDGGTNHLVFTPVGGPLLTTEQIAEFASSCANNDGSINFSVNSETGEYEFVMPLNPAQHSFFLSALFRNTSYVLDAKGMVTGFSFLYINRERFYTRASLRGYSTIRDIRYLAEIQAGKPVCLYGIGPDTTR